MCSIASQKDLLVTFKNETYYNVCTISRVHQLPTDLNNLKEALEKPTQHVFIHLTYYLVCIIDSQKAGLIKWPLYDTKSEKSYKAELSTFIAVYIKQGVISPLMSSYFVNPGCFKVVKLMFQLSQLALKNDLVSKMKKQEQILLLTEVSIKYKSGDRDFSDFVNKEIRKTAAKFIVYQQKKQAFITISDKMKKKILELEKKLMEVQKEYLNDLVNNFTKLKHYNETILEELNRIKNVNEKITILESWSMHIDDKFSKLVSQWNNNDNALPFIKKAETCKSYTEELIKRHSGEMDKKKFMLEYDPKTDHISCSDLENQVNSQQKFILKNVVKESRLNFPNLIRSYVISLCYMLKNAQIGEDIYKFNEYLNIERCNYKEVVSNLKELIERVMVAEAKIQGSPEYSYNRTLLSRGITHIPPLPDLRDLRTKWDHSQILFESFTPLNPMKNQFKFKNKSNVETFIKTQPKLMIKPIHQKRNSFISTLITSTLDNYELRSNMSYNMSIISQTSNIGNITKADCATGFTKQQIQRLLSTKKSSSKKHKFSTNRPSIKVKRGGLYNDTFDSGLYRSHSSPNLYDSKEKRSFSKDGARKFLMQEEKQTIMEMSGIMTLDNDSDYNTPTQSLENSCNKVPNDASIPVITISHVDCLDKFDQILKITEENESNIQDDSKRKNPEDERSGYNTPVSIQPVRKSSSIEKIINRYKKIRANVVSDTDTSKDFKTILEEKENNLNGVNIDLDLSSNLLRTDITSPTCSVVHRKPRNEIFNQLCFEFNDKGLKKPRESLGAALGVDNTFLDEIDLAD